MAACRLLCRFLVAGMTGYPRADAAGDQKAPRHEIAVGHAGRCRERYGDLAAVTGLMGLDRSDAGDRFVGEHGDRGTGGASENDVCCSRMDKIGGSARARALPVERLRERMVGVGSSIN